MNVIETLGKAVSDLTGWYPRGENMSKSFMSWSDWFRGGVSKKKLLEEYQNLVYACISVISQDVGRYEPFVYKKIVDGMPVPIDNHPLINLLENPNPEMSQYELFEATQTYLELTGDAYWFVGLGEITRRPKEITAVIRPDLINPVYKSGELIGYILCGENGNDVPFEIDEIVHFKVFNPKNQKKGYGPVEAGKLYIDIENETSLFQWGVLKNQASPAGVVGLKGKITPEAFEKLKKQWKENYGGTSNAGKTLFIRETDATFTKVGLSLNDISIPDLSKVNDEKIRKMFKVPRELLGDTSNSGLGRANIESIEYLHAKRNIDPKFVRLDDILTTLLRRYWNEVDSRVSHVSHIPQDEDKILNQYNLGVDRWITRNEVRRAKGLGEIKGGDVLYVPFSNIPIESQENAVTPQVGNVTNSVKKEEVHNHDHQEKGLSRVEKGRRDFFRILDSIEVFESSKYGKGLKSLLSVQESDVLEKVKSNLKRSIKKRVSFDGTLFELSFDDESIETNLLTWLLSAFMKSGESTLESLGKPDKEFLISQAQRESIFNSTDRLMKSFNEETAIKLQQQIGQGLELGEDVEKISKRIESVYDDARGFRATRISDTEIHKAVNEATASVYKQEGYTKLRWEVNPDACAFCLSLNGEEVEMDQPFVPVGGSVKGDGEEEYVNDYVDVKYADLHPNCKCRLVPVK